MRRSIKSAVACPEVRLVEQSPVIFEQHAFLSNSTNKDNFIQLLMSHLDHEGCRTIQSEGDADIDIVKEALTLASKQQGSIAVVGDDTDLLVLLSYHLQENMADIWLLSEAKSAVRRASDFPSRLINIRTLQRRLGATVCQQLLVLHAFSGCDTTSALFGRGKGKVLRIVTAVDDAVALTETMQNLNASADNVDDAGCKLNGDSLWGKSHGPAESNAL